MISLPILASPKYDLDGNFIAARFYGTNNSGNFSTSTKKGIKLYNSYWKKKENGNS
jgi:hypothetical protein